MKPHLRSLKKNQEVWATVEDVIAQEELVINFSGDLVRVQNQTARPFRVGQRVLLSVQSVSPLKLRLILRNPRPRVFGSVVDLSI